MTDSEAAGTPGSESTFIIDRKIAALKRRLTREGTFAVSMLEQALAAMWKLDAEAARAVRLSDDRVDTEEVEIEQQCYELLALRAPYAHDFRMVTFILRANSVFERVADHASSIAKVVMRISNLAGSGSYAFPTALVELGQRVPALCHETLKSVLDEDVDLARKIVASDAVIDQLEKRLFEETVEQMQGGARENAELAIGLLIYRSGRELERIGDLMASIAEDIVYVRTGQIVRHEKRKNRQPG